jgi:NAD+ synthase (glutamine-hydrolysing)
MDYGFFRACAASPGLKVADVEFNVSRIVESMAEAAAAGARLVLFPELSVTAYTCADLFHQERLIKAAEAALPSLAAAAAAAGICAVVGLPMAREGRLWNCAAVLSEGRVAGVVPKSFIPNYKEFYESRWFASARASDSGDIAVNGERAPFGPGLLFEARPGGGRPFLFAVEICEDLWVPAPPSSFHALRGASLILNLSASNEIVAKAEYRRSLVLQQSSRCVAAYLYAGAGAGESTTDLVFSGHCLAAEYGSLLAESERFSRGTRLAFADFDIERLEGERRRLSTFSEAASRCRSGEYGQAGNAFAGPVPLALGPWDETSFQRRVDPRPFVPDRESDRDERCREIFSIQTAALAKRLEHAKAKTAVIGVSGGLDSALALLAAAKTMDLLGRPRSDILAATMPGFGTSGGTLAQAKELCAALGTALREIDIKPACLLHFKDIGHDPAVRDVAYENVQARERTQVLMDLANESGGIVVGTGDLSEMALGWSTYNGDHMSMYAVNCGVPKTLVKHLVSWVAAHEAGPQAASALRRIVETPISPELLPPDEGGSIAQRTEDIIGPYELHDFFLYHHVRWGSGPDKVAFLAERAFSGAYAPSEIRRWLELFYQRFFSQQFKRSCVPDGPKVGSISLSPRGDWRMSSDSSPALWARGGRPG